MYGTTGRLEKGYRAYGAELEADYNLVEAGMARPRVKAQIVSFKLETDPSLLVTKAEQALDRYGHDLVIGNLLATRKWEVVFIIKGDGERWIRVPKSRRSKSFSGIEEKFSDLKILSGSSVINFIQYS